MSFVEAWNSEPPVPASIDAEIASMRSLFNDIAYKLEGSRKSIHACCTALGTWNQRINYFKAKYLNERAKHASTRTTYEEIHRAYRNMYAQTELASSNIRTAGGRNERHDAPLLSGDHDNATEKHHTTSLTPSASSERTSIDHAVPVQYVSDRSERLRPAAIQGRKRKRSDSAETTARGRNQTSH